jgi:hypothetical protein
MCGSRATLPVGENAPVPIDMVLVSARPPVAELMVDRGTGRTWTVEVDAFEIARTVVTVGRWNALFGMEPEPRRADFPKVEVTWRQAVSFCNEMSLRDGSTPTYIITTIDPPAQRRHSWAPHYEPAPDEWCVCHGTEKRTGTAYRQTPSGRLRAEQARMAPAIATWTTSPGMRITPTAHSTRLQRRSPIRGGCPTPWVEYGSGAGTSTTRRCTAPTASSEEAAGATRTGPARSVSVARPIPRLHSMTSASASRERRPTDGGAA